MIFDTYVVCWDDVRSNVINIENAFKSVGQKVTVINSGARFDGWENVGDIRYYRQLYYALKKFDASSDYMAFICGDVSTNDWPAFIKRFNTVLGSYDNVGLYATHFTNEPWNEGSTKLANFAIGDGLFISSNTDGIAFFMHRDIAKIALDYFEYLYKDENNLSMISGWGIDAIWSALSMYNDRLILRDNKFILNHPAGSSYSHSDASAEVVRIMDCFKNFCEENNFDTESIFNYVRKIHERMARDPKSMSYSDFYSKDLMSFKTNKDLKYHIISVDDTRKYNKDLIKSVIGLDPVNIDCLDARVAKNLDKFLSDNAKFKFGWEGFKLGEIGNFGSHYLAWRYVVENNIDSLLVFEDDSLIDEDFLAKYNISVKNTPKDYDVLSIFVHDNQYPRFTQSDNINQFVSKGYQDWSTLCYVVSRQGAKKLIKYVESVGMDHPTDWFIFRKGHNNIFNVYTLHPDFQPPLKIDTRYESQVQ